MRTLRFLTALVSAVVLSLGAAANASAILPSVVVTIPDADFKACLNDELGQLPGAAITDTQLAGIPGVSCLGDPIHDLTGWHHLTGITVFVGVQMELAGALSVPASLSNLVVLDLSENALTSVSIPATLTQAQLISVRFNRLSSFSLPSTVQPDDIYLNENRITDLSGLSHLPTTSQVHATNQSITLPNTAVDAPTALTLEDHRAVAPSYTAGPGTSIVGSTWVHTGFGTHTVSFQSRAASAAWGDYDGVITQSAVVPAATDALGDHTGDAKADIFTVNPAGTLHFWRGSSTGLATFLGARGQGWQSMSFLAQINDITGDARSDLLARRSSDQSLWLYRSRSMGFLESWRQMGQNWGGMDQIVPAFNLAGGSTQYVVARRASDGALFRYTLTPTGLTGIAHIGQNWQGMRQILSVGDFNADGRSDVLAIRNDGTLWSYLGQSNATIGSGTQVGQGWTGFLRAFCAGDMSGDGNNDLLGQRSDGVVFVYNNLIGRWGPARQVMVDTSGFLLLA